MGPVTRVLLFAIGIICLAMTAVYATQGDAKGAGAAFAAVFVTAFIGGVGWFSHRFPMPPNSGEAGSKSAMAEVKRFADRYSGWPGRLVKFGLPALVILAIVARILDIYT